MAVSDDFEGLVGTPEADEATLRRADGILRANGERPLLTYGAHSSSGCQLGAVGGTLRPGLLFCQHCGAVFGRGQVKWTGIGGAVLYAVEYERDRGNPAEAGRVLWESVRAELVCLGVDWEPEGTTY